MSRNGFPMAPRRSARWTSHLRQFSRPATESVPEEPGPASESVPASPFTNTATSSPQRSRSPDSQSSGATIREVRQPHEHRDSRDAFGLDKQTAKPDFERTCTVTVNEGFAKDDVLMNLDHFDASVQPGQLMAVDVLPDQRPNFGSYRRTGEGEGVTTDGTAGGEGVTQRRYLFTVKDMPDKLKARHPSVELYVAKHIADVFGMKKGSSVLLTRVDANNPAIEASHVEIMFRDQYMSRADMWRMAVAELSERTIYSGQRVLFMSTIKAQVSNVFVDGQRAQSAFFGKNTRPIFRSESARYVLFIQMAREMWDFDSDGSGEILFSKVVNGFLPTLFKKWASRKVKHLVTIVLFARVEYDAGLSFELTEASGRHEYYTGVQLSGSRRPYKDFYRVVVSSMASGEWTRILHQLKSEFNLFRRDISLHHLAHLRPETSASGDDGAGARKATSRSPQHMRAESSAAMYGNVLEAINMATTLYAYDYIDRDLTRTGISVAIITPGSGVFEVDYDAMRRTTEAVIGNGIGIDLICVPPMPLHSAPLFRFRAPVERSATKPRTFSSHSPGGGISGSTPRQAALFGSYSSMGGSSLSPSRATDATLRPYEAGTTGGGLGAGARIGTGTTADHSTETWAYALPQWLHVSYWASEPGELLMRQGVPPPPVVSYGLRADGSFYEKEFVVRCRMYALQMRGVLETNEIETAPLHLDPLFPRSAYRPLTGAAATRAVPTELDGVLYVRSRLPANVLFDQVLGFNRFSVDKYLRDGRPLWKQLVEYDGTRQKLTETRHNTQMVVRRREGESGVSGLSGASTVAGPSVLRSTFKTKDADSRRLSTNTSGGLSGLRAENKARDSASHSTSKMPRALRQISLGQRGFGIAAPKAAVAEISAETVAAAVSHLTPASSGPATRNRPPTTPSRPIVIRNGVMSDSASQRSGGSPLSTPMGHLGVSMSHMGTMGTGVDRDVTYSNALRAEDDVRIFNSKLLAEAVPSGTKTLSAAAALMPWLALINPCKPEANKIDLASFNSRWQHVFPRPGEQRAMKWKTLCAPAAVPLTTESFPSREQLQNEYQRQPYNVAVAELDDDTLVEAPSTNEDLLRELISRRFAQGFQVVIGPAVARAFGLRQLKIADVFCPGRFVEEGESVFMSMGNTIHQLSCTEAAGVEVNIFQRRTGGGGVETDGTNSTPSFLSCYRPAIRTLLDRDYETSEFDLLPSRPQRKWNYIDAYLAGHDDRLTENLRFWRARFVLIPLSAKAHVVSAADSEEELRLEGIRRLGQLWQKHRVVPPAERRFQAVGQGRRKDANPLDVVYKTEDPSVVIAAELETLPLLEGRSGKQLVTTSRAQFRKSNLTLAALAEAIQQPVESGGIRMQNRRWHLRLHYNCFIGSDMTSWLLDNFEDLESREDAEELGNMLMVSDEEEAAVAPETTAPGETATAAAPKRSGIFVHVERRHPFRDGQYFYQISSELAKPAPSSWFSTRKRDLPTPSTPTELSATGPTIGTLQSTATQPTYAAPERPRVVLSKMIKYDVDHRKRSYRAERVDLHYDRLHNPDSCYHIRLEWMNVTAKLIEDVVEAWAREALQFGLRLVEVPIQEACRIADRNPFRRPYPVRLARAPPAQLPPTYSSYYDPASLTPQPPPALTARHFYQKAMLRRFGFVLDTEAATNFPANVDVSYSWGRPSFRYTQYIHRSGLALAEITDDGNFLLVANRLYSSRIAMRDARTSEQQPAGSTTVASAGPPGPSVGPVGPPPVAHHKTEATPMQSPLLKATRFGSPRVRAATGAVGTAGLSAAAAAAAMAAAAAATSLAVVDPEAVMAELEAFCLDEAALDAFYRETLLERQAASVAATPAVAATAATIPETSIPDLGLPPGIFSLGTGGGPGPCPGPGPGSIGASSRSGSGSHRLDLTAYDGMSSPSSQTASPAFRSSQQLFRRGSVDDYGRQEQ